MTLFAQLIDEGCDPEFAAVIVELVARGLVYDTGTKRLGKNGKMQSLWAATANATKH